MVLLSEKSPTSYLVVGVSPISYSTVDSSVVDERELVSIFLSLSLCVADECQCQQELLKIWSNFKHFFALAAKDSRDGFTVEGTSSRYSIRLG